jgi:DNA-binding transcriptional ArsR family regulator
VRSPRGLRVEFDFRAPCWVILRNIEYVMNVCGTTHICQDICVVVFFLNGKKNTCFARRPVPDSRRSHPFADLATDWGTRSMRLLFRRGTAGQQPKISRHLAYLLRSGIVHARKDGKWVHYGIAFPSNPSAAAILRQALAWTAEMPEARRDRVRFAAACCRPQKFVSLRGAPPPGPAAGSM